MSQEVTKNNVAIAHLTVNFVSEAIDTLMKLKFSNNEKDYASGIAKLFLAKAVIDTKASSYSITQEISLAAMKKAKDGINGTYIMTEDLDNIMIEILDQISSFCDDKVDDLEGQMSWTELSSLHELCGG